MVPHRCLTLMGGLGGGLVCRTTCPCGDRCSMVAVSVSHVSLGGAWVVACRRSRHRQSQGIEITWMPDKGGAEGGHEIAEEGHVCCSCFLLRVDGG